MSKPRLLVLSQTLPFPPDEGVKIRTYHTFRILSSLFELDALCFYRASTTPNPHGVSRAIKELTRFGKFEAFPIPQESSRLRWTWDHARSALSRRSYVLTSYESRAFRSALRDRLRGSRYDLVHMESLDLAGYAPELNDLPVVCTHHNVESSLLATRADREPSRVGRTYLRQQARWTEALERAWTPHFRLNILVSNQDESRLAEIAPTARTAVIPNGVDTDYFQPASGISRAGAVFVGGTTWYPNRDALDYYVHDIAPRVESLLGHAPTVRWVGNASEEDIHAFSNRAGIEMTGYVDDIRPHVHSAMCYVVPLRTGGGTRLKVLDAWAMGMPVVSTPIGAEGLEARHGENILLAEGPDEFASCMVQLLTNPQLRSELGASARQTVMERYSWDQLRPRFLESYEEVMVG
jgi:polysaccharide biosynthesis protein PslH